MIQGNNSSERNSPVPYSQTQWALIWMLAHLFT